MNPHDDVALFESEEELVEWVWEIGGPTLFEADGQSTVRAPSSGRAGPASLACLRRAIPMLAAGLCCVLCVCGGGGRLHDILQSLARRPGHSSRCSVQEAMLIKEGPAATQAAALEAARGLTREPAAAALASLNEDEAGELRSGCHRILLQPGARVDARFLAVAGCLQRAIGCGDDEAGTLRLSRRMLALRCSQLARAAGGSLLADLGFLAADGAASPSAWDKAAHPWDRAVSHYGALARRAQSEPCDPWLALAAGGVQDGVDPEAEAKPAPPARTEAGCAALRAGGWEPARFRRLVTTFQAYKKMILWDGMFCGLVR